MHITLHTYKTRSSLQFRKFGISVKELDFMSLKAETEQYTSFEIVIVEKSDNR